MMTIFGMQLSLFIAELGIVVTAVSAAAGIWIERDRKKPLRVPVSLTIFVLFASCLSMYQCLEDDADQAELQENLAKVLEQLDLVATQSEVDVPELNDLLQSEMMIQGRANPRVLADMARRIAARGGDPFVMLATYLPEAELQAMKRAGSFDEAMKLFAGPKANATKRPKLTFGSNPPALRIAAPDVGGAGAGGAGANPRIDDAAALLREPADAGDAGMADSGAVMETLPNASNEEATLKVQIAAARRKVAEAKTSVEKRDRERELFVLLGAADKLKQANAAKPQTPAASTSGSSRPKKPEIEIEEDGTP